MGSSAGWGRGFLFGVENILDLMERMFFPAVFYFYCCVGETRF